MLRKYFIRLSIVIIVILSLTLGYLYLNRLKFINDTKPLNLVIISIDALRADHMGIYGYNKDTTPNIDKWAKDAFVFSNAITTAPLTYPSFATLMTRIHPFVLNIFSNEPKDSGHKISNNSQTLAKILHQNGFATGAFVTNEVLKTELTNLGNGFDVFNFNSSSNSRQQSYLKLITDSVDWLEKNKDKRFFLWVHLLDPHSPYEPPEDLICKFNEKYCNELKTKIVEKGLQKLYDDLEKQRFNTESCKTTGVPKEDVELMETLYNGEVAAADRLAGKLLDELVARKLDNRTLVILYSDHGEGFDHDYLFKHGDVLFNSAINIPLIIKYPSIKNSQKRISNLIDNTDIMPTILDLLNISSKDLSIDGKSFSKFFYPVIPFSLFNRKYVYSINSSETKYSIYDGRYKFIYSLPSPYNCLYNNQTEELYDTKKDPEEKINLVTIESHLSTILKSTLLNHLAKYNLPPAFTDTTSSEFNKSIEKLKSLGY